MHIILPRVTPVHVDALNMTPGVEVVYLITL